MSRICRIIMATLIPLALILAWAAGEFRKKEALTQQLSNISEEINGVIELQENLFKGYIKENPDHIIYMARAGIPSYGGILNIAIAVDTHKKIQYVAILDSKDTHSYLEKVVNLGILDEFTGKSIDAIPHVDGVSGATLTSNAIIRGIEQAGRHIGSVQFAMSEIPPQKKEGASENLKLFLICLFFLSAYIISRKGFKHKKRARSILLVLSVITLGFWLGAQFSIATLVTLLSGSWIHGMATYAALLCLVLSIAAFLITRKNLFCNFICPFGALQEGLSKITGCRPPVNSKWMTYMNRAWVFIVLMAGLYFQTPSDAMYEPFSKAFNFIGSGIIYSLTILIVVSSLMFKRPWCNLFCPGKAVFFYLQFTRRIWGKPSAQSPFPIDTSHSKGAN